nr:2309_t:CDS:2 [Entrophospora candida]
MRFFSSKSKDNNNNNICYNIEGFLTCSYFKAAVDLVYEGCKSNDYKFIGGYSDFSKLVESRHKLDNVSTSSSLNIKDDVNGCEDGKLLDLASSNTDLNPASRNYRHLIKSQLSLSKIINVYFDSIPYEITKEGEIKSD